VLAIRCQLAPLSPQWQALCAFAADYYQRPLGEVALPGLPKNLRVLKTTMLDRALKKLAKAGVAHDATPAALPVLNAAQQHAADVIAASQGFAPYLLYGITGSGKTEVYLQAAANILARNDDAQILILVPEINLTPQLEANIRARFPGVAVATLHSSLTWDAGIAPTLASQPAALQAALRNSYVNTLKQNFKLDADSYSVGMHYKIGNGRIMGSVSRQNDKTAFNNDATQYAIGYDHNLSKRTDIYTVLAYIKNENNAQYAPGAASAGGGFTSAGGESGKAFQVGMRHRF